MDFNLHTSRRRATCYPCHFRRTCTILILNQFLVFIGELIPGEVPVEFNDFKIGAHLTLLWGSFFYIHSTIPGRSFRRPFGNFRIRPRKVPCRPCVRPSTPHPSLRPIRVPRTWERAVLGREAQGTPQDRMACVRSCRSRNAWFNIIKKKVFWKKTT